MYIFFGCPFEQKSILIKNQNECVMCFVNVSIEYQNNLDILPSEVII